MKNLNPFCFIFVTLWLVVPLVSRAEPSASNTEQVDTYLVELKKRVARNWEPVRVSVVDQRYDSSSGITKELSAQPLVNVYVSPDGTIEDVKIQRSTGIVATDLVAEDAIWGCSPLNMLPAGLNARALLVIDFADFDNVYMERNSILPKAELPCSKYVGGSLFGRGTSSHEEPLLTIHAVPVDILQRYPGLFEFSEIHSAENLRSLKVSQANDQLIELRKKWQIFFKSHPTSNKSEVLEFRKQLDLTHPALLHSLPS